jgi:dTDP-4-dehydrorhamnose 3,5-epimerase-like enzyme
MKKKNIFKNVKHPLQLHFDERGLICDIFYKKKYDHVTYVKTRSNKIRGNHYHKKTTQVMLILNGVLEYWYKNINSKKIKKILLKKGDLINTPPLEIHAMKTLKKNCEFIVFTKGLRGGKDYEKDTFRSNIL